jgi:hypothetical protein
MVTVTVLAWWPDERRQALQPLPVPGSMRTAASREEPSPCSSHLGRRLRRDERAARRAAASALHPFGAPSLGHSLALASATVPALQGVRLPRSSLPLHALIAISRGPTGLSVYASSVLFTRLAVSLPFGRSAPGATLDTGGWLTLTRRGLAPPKIRQAWLGTIAPALTRRAQNAPVPACPIGLAAPVGWSALFGSPLALLVRAHLGACPRCSDPHQCRASEFHNRLRTGSNSEAAPDSPPPTSGTTPAVPKSFDHPSGPR